MTPTQAFNVLCQATEPGVKLNRADYVNIQIALQVVQSLLQPAEPVVIEPTP